MPYINCGATRASGDLFPTKKSLRDAMTANPEHVTFIVTSPLGGDLFGGRYCDGAKLAELPAGVKLSVVGPDPERSRKWYATVEVKAGKVKVS